MDEINAPATKGDFARLDYKIEHLDQKMDGVRSDLSQKIDGVRSDLSQKIDGVRSDLNQKIDGVRSDLDQFRSEVNHIHNDIVERIADGETRLLKAFYDFAQSNQKRMTELEGNEAAIRSRMATIEDRLLQVERRLNMPPAA